MKIQKNTYQQRQLALEGTVRQLVHEIFNKSRNEAEAMAGFAVLEEVVSTFQKGEMLEPVPSRAPSGHIPGTENIDVNELTEAVLNDSEDALLTKLFKGDNHAIKHFKETQSRKTFARLPKPVVKENQEAAKKPAAQTERELAKKEATDKGDLLKLTQLCKEEDRLFTPNVGFDGKLNFTGNFRRMENRHV